MVRPVIALLTDFGLRDHYVGTMKGVMLGICPEATFVDISHEIPPQDVEAAALELAAAYRYFPASTVFLVVVDPGVGSARRAIAIEAERRRFVAPDNGVLSAMLESSSAGQVVELTDRRYQLSTVSRTFEGRDRFAPAAAWLAAGVELAALGRAAGSIHRLDRPQPIVMADGIEGLVLRVDRFGNLTTNIERETLAPLSRRGPIQVHIAGRVVSLIVSAYAEATPGALCALLGSTDHLEIAVAGGSAARVLTVARGAPVTVRVA